MIVETIEGACKCGRKVNRVKLEGERTFRVNGYRYEYADRPQNRTNTYDIFRCDGCLEVIEESWQPSAIAA